MLNNLSRQKELQLAQYLKKITKQVFMYFIEIGETDGNINLWFELLSNAIFEQ